MNIDQYQILAARSLNPDMSQDDCEDMAMLGMIGELGELTEIFKKKIFHGKELTADRVREEAGDFLWYIALSATVKKNRFSEMAGLPQFDAFDGAAEESVLKAIEDNKEYTAAWVCERPFLFFRLVKGVTGTVSVPELLTILGILLQPYGGLAWAARDNIRKLESRHNLPAGDLEAVLEAFPSAVVVPEETPDVAETTTTPLPVAGNAVATTTPGSNE